MDQLLDIKLLVKEIKKVSELTQAEIAEKIGYKRAYLSEAIGKGGTPKLKNALKALYDEYLREYRILGKDDAWNFEQKNKLQFNRPYFMDRVAQDVLVRGNFPDLFYENRLVEQYDLPPGLNAYKEQFMYFEMNDHTMLPTIQFQDILLCARVEEENYNELKNLDLCVIYTLTAIHIKRVLWQTDNSIILFGDNLKLDAPMKVSWSDISEIWKYRCHITKAIPLPEEVDINKIERIVEEKSTNKYLAKNP